MGNFWLRLKAWVKTFLLTALVIYALFFIYNNSGKPVDVWVWFGSSPLSHSVLVTVLGSFVLGMITTLLLTTTYRTYRQVRDMRQRSRAERIEREMEEMKVKASKLQRRPEASLPEKPVDEQGGN